MYRGSVRRPFFLMKFRTTTVLLSTLLPALPALAGCSASAPASSFGASQHTTVTMVGGADGGDGGGATAATDAGVDAPAAATNVGYALCAHTSSSCDPDVADTAQSCALAPDGGPYDPAGGYAAAPLACRVQPAASVSANGQGSEPACSVAGAGMDGAACKSGTDCAAGFDCIGSGECRHYCCEGNTMCAGTEFCDVQPLALASTTKVPVCMPIMPAGGCMLLVPNQCPMGETCSIVREDGTTGCVEIGDRKAGDPCDAAHCAAGLVCLGAPDARLCYELCHTSSATCSQPQTCQGGLPLFQDPSVGVCR